MCIVYIRQLKGHHDKIYLGCPDDEPGWLDVKGYGCVNEDGKYLGKLEKGDKVECDGNYDCAKDWGYEGVKHDGKYYWKYDGSFDACKAICHASITGDVDDEDVDCGRGEYITHNDGGDCYFQGEPGDDCLYLRKKDGDNSAMYCGGS